MGGWSVGGWEKNEINAIINSVEVKVEVGVELGDFINFLKRENVFLNAWYYVGWSWFSKSAVKVIKLSLWKLSMAISYCIIA